MKRSLSALLILAATAVASCSSGGRSGSSTTQARPTTSTVVALSTSSPITTTPASEPLPNPATCGAERITVKDGLDADAARVDQGNVRPTTVADLIALQPPATLGARTQPVEFTVYRLSATIIEYKHETDNDYHVVVSDPAGHTMIVEIPSPACVTAGPFHNGIAASRAAFDSRFHASSALQHTAVPATVTGVGFFDFKHGQTGVAPNAIELHPVLSIQF